ncbi:dihydroorotate dehydrogenase A (fumarate) [Lactobacillus delbrueckii subsp. bulgaricus]|uniref:Dihydroorotate dehydrogenase n=1 Tax=Lactobacillus delbrueckii subsp. bulgaricus (strain ATCC 11842 / DSM 20081 / BCRC 10696 / JCM 1002 / NBRC 13953 / NCIMB 11778 / NCTC 12712 / WDCM 00102 / Lb 14) TaxID=390333 RepID=Q1G992_LACDA|nr:dihydroorotate dehydrogenase [Lactobacillus delbrueckii]KRN37387.1 dihydroorotate dehydrogenase [Lactobacillus delbrueckii subsp. bulgaricus ATCC 11842 = JCM 1002]MDG9747933.1 dihydroorotate dehydrogenase [Lactobacillus delbrueckii subsp. bulgaricus ATCC 11842 = JCM 1002]GEB91421.1 dihydroorotate dehydrogenase A (fumarate) [Lactobacillus delbrueckii subsp. bulgaricus]CAI98330.1 Dihydroorotate dehydrogenase [Lactobacillus delbrueckii subsp. bulgaricus ATCC 11842 = JCM 1002]
MTAEVNLAVELPGLKLKNPVMPASGTFAFGDLPENFNWDEMGAIVLKTATRHARTGNPQPQIDLLADGVMNAVGLTNPGAEVVASEKIPALREKHPDLPILASVGGESVEDYVEVAEILAAAKPDALELNLSCPNVSEGGMTFGIVPEMLEKITRLVKEKVDLPVYVKLTPNVTSIVEIAQAAEGGGADGLTLINTLLVLHLDLKTRRPVLGNDFGGLYGQAVKPVAVRMVAQVKQATSLPIIGVGGINSPEDAAEFILAGASAVQIGSMSFYDKLAIKHVIDGLPAVLAGMGASDVTSLVGQWQSNKQ